MKIKKTLNLTRMKVNLPTKKMKISNNGAEWVITDKDPMWNELVNLYSASVGKSDIDKEQIFDSLINDDIFSILKQFILDNISNATDLIDENATVSQTKEITSEELVKNAITGMMKFFSEFDFSPNFRFLNSLSRITKKEEKLAYISNYFELINSPYAQSVNEKIKSKEFKSILKDFSTITSKTEINKRFKIYYGAQGTGKTTKALNETNNCCVVCHSAMLPTDLMEDFKFDDKGNPIFIPSPLYNAMENGTPITLDEINLLPFESLRFLQGILDGKTEFQYKDKTVHIADGFYIIGTMNLTVNGMTYGLPEPLVDRCSITKKFELTADTLLSAII